MSRITHIEISANDPEKIIKFYTEVFNWKVTKWEGPVDYWLVSTGDPDAPGADGAFFRPHKEMTGTIATVEVEDIDAAEEKILQNGGEIVVEKNVIPGIGYQLYGKDVEGTIFGVHQTDPNAGMA